MGWSRDEVSDGFETLSARSSYGFADSAAVTRDSSGGVDTYRLFAASDASLSLRTLDSLAARGLSIAQVKDEYTKAAEVLWRADVDDDEAEEASDRLVRYGMFLCAERVEPVISKLIREAPQACARCKLVDQLADYDVPLSSGLRDAILSRLKSEDEWEFLGAVFALLRDAKDGASQLVEGWSQTKKLEGEQLEMARGALSDLREQGVVV